MDGVRSVLVDDEYFALTYDNHQMALPLGICGVALTVEID